MVLFTDFYFGCIMVISAVLFYYFKKFPVLFKNLIAFCGLGLNQAQILPKRINGF